jgi:hypothetical protein
MRRWLLPAVVIVVVVTALFLLRPYLLPPVAPHSGLFRTPNSAYKYHLCTESYAYAYASADFPFKTNFTFRDPFREGDDTIIPRLLGYDARTHTVNFSVQVIVNQVATFNEFISHIQELDGISVMLPDTQNHLQHSGIPQFIVSALEPGRVAILDYTCPGQWIWHPNH